MQKFSGDVRDYSTFKADFKHLGETRYSKRDAITLLRASLQGKPLDTITQDIARFKPLRDRDDGRNCDLLVHLVKRSFITPSRKWADKMT